MPVTINGTTGIAGVDGSASVPSVQGSDTNTGVFYPAADTVGVSTGGSERMRVDSSGNVGVGTSLPSAKIHSYVGSASQINNLIQNTASYINYGVFADGNNYVYSGTATNLLLGTNNTERMRIDSSGNVGIGTSGPGTRLDISNPASELVMQAICTNANKYGFVRVYNTNNGSNPIDYGVNNDGSALIINRAAPVTGTRAFTLNYGPVGDYLRIDTGGRVTKPYQTSFLAACGVGTHTTAGNTVLDFNSVIHNVGNNYNNGTYTFTAPVAGMYFFYFQVYQQNGGNNASFAYRKNGTDFGLADAAIAFKAGGINGDSTWNSSIILNLAANDTIAVGVRNGATSVTWYGGHSWFMGYLLG